jgi:hypothetical protein
MAGHHRTIYRSFFTNHDAGTTFRSIDRTGIFNFLCKQIATITDKKDCKNKVFVHKSVVFSAVKGKKYKLDLMFFICF